MRVAFVLGVHLARYNVVISQNVTGAVYIETRAEDAIGQAHPLLYLNALVHPDRDDARTHLSHRIARSQEFLGARGQREGMRGELAAE